MVKGSAPIQMLKNGMGEAMWRKKEKLSLDYLQQRVPLVPTTLFPMTGWEQLSNEDQQNPVDLEKLARVS